MFKLNIRDKVVEYPCGCITFK